MTKSTWRLIGTASVYAVVLAFVASFGYSGLQGDRGLGALAEAKAEVARLEAELARLEAHRDREATRVARMRPDHLDLDLLDERARAVLGYARPDELILPPFEP